MRKLALLLTVLVLSGCADSITSPIEEEIVPIEHFTSVGEMRSRIFGQFCTNYLLGSCLEWATQQANQQDFLVVNDLGQPLVGSVVRWTEGPYAVNGMVVNIGNKPNPDIIVDSNGMITLERQSLGTTWEVYKWCVMNGVTPTDMCVIW